MPNKLPISDADRARRHVLGQRVYRLRRKYRYLVSVGLLDNAERVRVRMQILTTQYEALGGLPQHRGNRV